MDIKTHQQIETALCGKPVHIDENKSIVELKTTSNMSVDDKGLVHGGFIFGLADHAAMIAVNHPNVVLGSASVKFLKPVKIDERVTAEAIVDKVEGKKQIVNVTVKRDGGELVFEGQLICFVLGKHVLD